MQDPEDETETRLTPSLREKRARRRRRRKLKTIFSAVLAAAFILCIAAAAIFVVYLFKNNLRRPGNEIFEAPSPVFNGTAGVVFSAPSATATPTATMTVPTPTVTATFTSSPAPTETMTMTPTARIAEHSEASETPAAGTGSPVPTAFENSPENYAYRMVGEPGAVNAESVYENAGCTWLGAAGIVTDEQNNALIGIHVRIGGFEDGSTLEALSGQFPNYGESGWEITIARPVRSFAGPLWIGLFDDAGTPLSGKVYFQPDGSCDRNLILINFMKVY